jgi:hypothetical protein
MFPFTTRSIISKEINSQAHTTRNITKKMNSQAYNAKNISKEINSQAHTTRNITKKMNSQAYNTKNINKEMNSQCYTCTNSTSEIVGTNNGHKFLFTCKEHKFIHQLGWWMTTIKWWNYWHKW